MDGNVDTFSYAEPADPRLKKFIIRLIERMTGQPYLKSLYDDRFAQRKPGESFWDLAIRLLDLHVATNEDALSRLPKTGPLVVVANHPFGVLDGVIVCHLVNRVRGDFRILTNAVLNRADEVKEYLLPVDFTESAEALQTNLKSRATAKHHLLNGGCLIVFPAGGVSTTPKLWGQNRCRCRMEEPHRAAHFPGQSARGADVLRGPELAPVPIGESPFTDVAALASVQGSA
jgi:putative hemolysin